MQRLLPARLLRAGGNSIGAPAGVQRCAALSRRSASSNSAEATTKETQTQEQQGAQTASSSAVPQTSEDSSIPLDLDDASVAAAASSSSSSASAPASKDQRTRREKERLSEELKRQRRAQLTSLGLPVSDALRSDVDAPARSRRPPAVRKQRVDLYVNESGYPQAREGAEEHGQQREQKHPHHRNRQQRREHLAPAPGSDAAEDALTPLTMERPRSRGYDRAHNRPFRAGSAPGGEGSGSGLAAGVSPFRGAGPPSNRDRGGSSAFERRAGPSSGSRGTGGSGQAQRPRRPLPPRRRARASGGTGVVQARKLSPAPGEVHENGSYSLASPLSSSLGSDLRARLDGAQWQRAQAELDLESKKDKQAIAKGDWEKYLSPLLAKDAQKKGKGRSGVQQDIRDRLLENARAAMAANGSVGLKGKLELAKKLEATV